jgi:pilus assembly protein CpaB
MISPTRLIRIVLSRVNRMWMLFFVALLLGLAATWVTTRYIHTREMHIEAEAKKRASGGATIAVVVPVRDLAKGAVVDGDVMAAREILTDLVYSGETIMADDFGKYQGMKLVRPIEHGRPLRVSDLESGVKEFADVLPEGRRAITIDVDEINSVSQMVRPGNLVDLMLIMTDPNDTAAGQQVMLLLQHVKVLATGQLLTKTVERGPGAPQGPMAAGGQAAQPQRYSNITLDVAPEEAARIALAQQLGKIRAVLRNEDDKRVEPAMRVDTQTLLSGVPLGKKGGPGARPTVQFIIGGQGSGGAGTTVNVNMPGALGLGNAPAGAASTGAVAGQPGQGGPGAQGAGPAPGTGQVNIPGVGNVPFGVPFDARPTAPASTPRFQ